MHPPVHRTNASAKVSHALETASDSLAVALAPSKETSNELKLYVDHASRALVKYTSAGQHRIDVGLQHVRDRLSKPENLVTSAIGLELLVALYNLAQFYDYTVFFPPAPATDGIVSLVNRALFWSPSFAVTLRLPELASFKLDSDLWPALAWWFTSTVLPPLALSTVINSHVKPKVHSHNTRSQCELYTLLVVSPLAPTCHVLITAHADAKATPDPLVFTLIRLAIALYPLTDAAPRVVTEALEQSGNLQIRALGAGLLAALLLATRLS